ncbi:MAG: DUF4197 domain-containing protein [Candidatus Krumholzibacteria bacterium]|nr:DUF4197 domain-containing protein [Candidatus Krumholzibacteria bacterium]
MIRRDRRSAWFAWCCALLGCAAGCSQMADLDLDGVLGGAQPLDERTVVAGLKEALAIGTERTVERTHTRDGYLGNALLRIALPPAVQDLSGTLRSVGLGAKVDELAVAMNRAAELAAGEATALFVETIKGLTLQDAWGILKGHDTAATDYFRERTAAALTARYRPIVQTSLQRVGGYAEYEDLVARIEALPLLEPPDLDLVGYVTDHALAGLFTVLGEEEQRIRADPLARTTALLQRVFGAP